MAGADILAGRGIAAGRGITADGAGRAGRLRVTRQLAQAGPGAAGPGIPERP
jgi:hypothetical protein